MSQNEIKIEQFGNGIVTGEINKRPFCCDIMKIESDNDLYILYSCPTCGNSSKRMKKQ